ncbi:MAG: tetratricopeptide repeat protein [Nitrospiria bacterium]
MKKRRNRIALIATIILFPALILMPPTLLAESEVSTVAFKERPLAGFQITKAMVEKITRQGDYLYDTRDMADHAERAIIFYKKIIEIDPGNHEVHWRLSRSYKWRGDRAASPKEKLAAYKAAVDCAKKAIALDPEGINGHLMLGMSYGLIGQTQGLWASLGVVSPIKKEMRIVLVKDPQNEIAHLILGILYRKLPTLFGGSLQKSIKALNQAVRANPHRTTPYLELARSYLEKGEREAARRSLERLLAIARPTDRVQSNKDRIAAGMLLASLS